MDNRNFLIILFSILRAYFLHNDEQLSTSETCFEPQGFTSVFHHVQQQFHAGKWWLGYKYLKTLKVT